MKKNSIAKKFIFIIIALSLCIGVSFFIFYKYNDISVSTILHSDFVVNNIKERIDSPNIEKSFDYLDILLGFEKPMTYLILLQNNTELRPGGGFIGSYAVVKVSEGVPEIILIEGTEIIDKKTPTHWKPKPPQIITDELGVDKWYFRDSNWSADFKENAIRGLFFYKNEGGVEAENIDAVVAFTPKILEEILDIIGPVEVNGITFTKENAVAALEYEVEYDFAKKGISVIDRKNILKPFFAQIVQKALERSILDWKKYIALLDKITEEKHMVVYFKDKKIQHHFQSIDWTGEVKENKSDFLLWVDANLAALKTDHAIERSLVYTIVEDEQQKLIANATMHYIHHGVFDWRTTRYRTFARVYVPKGAEFLEMKGVSTDTEVVKGIDGDKNWFGAFFTFEPGTKKSVSFIYSLPDNIKKNVEEGLYSLLVQKQLGTNNHRLTIDANFGKTIWKVSSSTDLMIDRTFLVNTK
jgi:hypothetical protein